MHRGAPRRMKIMLFSREKLCIQLKGSKSPPEILVIRGVLRPLEPILVKAGYSVEKIENRGARKLVERGSPLIPGCEEIKRPISVDATFCKNEDEIPYLPGSALRGCIRSHVEKVLRTLIYERFKNDDICLQAIWDLEKLKKKGKELSKERDFDTIYSKACIVSKLFGFTAMGGRIRLEDVYPTNPDKFKRGLKLLDHVAIDRFTEGAAEGKKFNSRPFFPKNPLDDSGDLEFRLELRDFELWHIGLVALVLKDLQLGKIRIGYGRTKGFGKVVLLPETVEIETLTHERGILKDLLLESPEVIGGFFHIPSTKVKSGRNFWVSKEEKVYSLVEKAINTLRGQINSWQPQEEQSHGT
ncbi:hypothetical protein HKBW3S34_01653 [Candidatus Hakubella thermalkaliphila]|nr:hypothetical protein HKBW3S34_01653 [Candidatus Hakubella thermalkaliphila]